jgi:hypothetical protein
MTSYNVGGSSSPNEPNVDAALCSRNDLLRSMVKTDFALISGWSLSAKPFTKPIITKNMIRLKITSANKAAKKVLKKLPIGKKFQSSKIGDI